MTQLPPRRSPAQGLRRRRKNNNRPKPKAAATSPYNKLRFVVTADAVLSSRTSELLARTASAIGSASRYAQRMRSPCSRMNDRLTVRPSHCTRSIGPFATRPWAYIGSDVAPIVIIYVLPPSGLLCESTRMSCPAGPIRTPRPASSTSPADVVRCVAI